MCVCVCVCVCVWRWCVIDYGSMFSFTSWVANIWLLFLWLPHCKFLLTDSCKTCWLLWWSRSRRQGRWARRVLTGFAPFRRMSCSSSTNPTACRWCRVSHVLSLWDVNARARGWWRELWGYVYDEHYYEASSGGYLISMGVICILEGHLIS